MSAAERAMGLFLEFQEFISQQVKEVNLQIKALAGKQQSVKDKAGFMSQMEQELEQIGGDL